MYTVRLFLPVLIILVISACSANHYSVFESEELEGENPRITTVDAKRRAILSTYYKTVHSVEMDGKTVDREIAVRRFCSEPSPDVFNVVAQSLTAEGSFSKGVDPKGIEAALKGAYSSTEGASTIPRTQTINLLREIMFRTCERYLNGAYDDNELAIQAIRDQRLIVSILAIEQLTGAVAPAPVSLLAKASASSVAGSEAVVRLDNAAKESESKASSLKDKQSLFDKTNTKEDGEELGLCDKLDNKVKKEESLTEEEQPKKKECDKVRGELAKAKQESTEADVLFQTLKTAAAGGSLIAASGISATEWAGLSKAHSKSLEHVADVVKSIIGINASDSTETLLICHRILLSRDQPKVEDNLRARCSDFLSSKVTADANAYKANISEEKFKLELEKIQQDLEKDFETFWKKNGSLADADWLIVVKNIACDDPLPSVRELKGCLLTAKEEGKAKECFKGKENCLTDIVEVF